MPDETIIIDPPALNSDAGAAMHSLMATMVEPPEEKEEKEETPPEPKKEEIPPETKEETPPEKKEEPKEETPSEEPEDKFNEEIDAIEPVPQASEKTKEAVKILKEKGKAEHKRAIEIEKQVKQLQAEKEAETTRAKELESKVVSPELEKEITELRNFREAYGLESDPSITSKFDQRVTEAVESTTGVLKAIAVPEPTIKYINENGGLYNFRMSNNFMPPAVKNQDGSRMTHAQFYATYIEKGISPAQREELSDAYAEIRKANRDKGAAIKNLQTNREEFTRKRQEGLKAAQEDWVKRVVTHSEKVLAQYGDAAKLRELPPNAPADLKAEIEKHNANFRKAESKAQSIISNVTPENLTEAAIAAGYVELLRDQVKESSDQITKLTEERDGLKKKLDELKNAGKTSAMRGTTDTPKAKAKAPKHAGDAMAQLIEDNLPA